MNTTTRPALAGTRPEPRKGWVSKTDVLAWLRCPYTFWLLHTGQVRFEDTMNAVHRRLLGEGEAFHRRVFQAARPLRELDLPALFGRNLFLLDLPVLRNPNQRIYGSPDGLHTEAGALLPVEVKSHREVSRTDELELAFYWMLLEPYRTRQVDPPRGFVIYRRNGRPEETEVVLRADRFDQVRQVLQEIRQARRQGVKPKICSCFVCRGAQRGEILRQTLEGKDLTLVFGINRGFAPQLEALGILTYEDLLEADPVKVAEQLKTRRMAVSPSMVERWTHHARSYQTQRPVIFGKTRFPHADFVAMDLEYDYWDGRIWLIGLCTVRDGRRGYAFLWADTSSEERRNLQECWRYLRDVTPLPLITWSGTSADIPKLCGAAKRLRVQQLLVPIEQRHVDAYQYTIKTLRLPIPEFTVKEVAGYFGIPRQSVIADGFEANERYKQYCRVRSARKKAAIKAELLQYSRDDLDGLVGTVERLRTLTADMA